jgi:E3 ubiquitin-protein ligase MARCH6
MEWLSHSQKKHCELCKTSFRFTKLYAPDMPQSLPLHIFLEHMAKYLARNLLSWMRATLAISIWICWLPLLMRAAWSCMFWISDEGLGGVLLPQQSADWKLSTAVMVSSQSPVTPLAPKTTTSLKEAAFAMANMASPVYPDMTADSMEKRLHIAKENMSLFFNSTGFRQKPANLITSSSLLSNVTFLRNLTRSPTINRAVTSVIEGQVITILVIICFILVILVRDYVVQQQPELNMRAAFADIPDPAPAADPEEPDNVHGANAHGLHQNPEAEPGPVDDAPAQQRLAPAGLNAHEEASVIEFLEVHRRAEGDPARVVQIIEEEGREHRLQYWLDVTRRAMRNTNNAAHEPGPVESAGTSQSTDRPESINEDTNPAVFHGEQDFGPESSSEHVATNSVNPLGDNTWSFSSLPAEPSSSANGNGPFASPSSIPRNTGDDEQHQSGPPEVDDAGSDDAIAGPSSEMQATPRQQDAEHHIVHERTEDEVIDGNAGTQNAMQDPRGRIIQPPPPVENEPVGLVGRVANFMWGDLDHPAEELAVQVMDEDQGHDDDWADIPVGGDGGENDHAPPAEEGVEVPPGFDQEAIEDMEDFEGVMELIGMRGPLAGLFQNAIFCAVLVSVTIFACIFVPYNIGRVTVWIMASPMRLVRMIVEISKLIQDSVVMVVGFIPWCVINFVDVFTVLMSETMAAKIVAARKASWAFWTQAGSRVIEYLFMDFPMSATEIQNFSAISHDALLTVKGQISQAAWAVYNVTESLHENGLHLPDEQAFSFAMNQTKSVYQALASSSTLFLNPGAWVIDLGGGEDASAVDPVLAHWSGTDRFWAIAAGYATVYLVAAMYLKRDSPFSTGQVMRAWEAGVIDTLQQASGIMKVILIISIEMLVFPLYCGMLLDIALLPLFAGTTVVSRLMFAYEYPLTSAFVHWFVGTGYMFHFALFVSMCRKIMRPGVLCKHDLYATFF